jgi:hypothetical protein
MGVDQSAHQTSADPKKLERIFAQAPPTPKVPRNLYSPNLNFFDIDDEEIARQITLIEYSMFGQIKVRIQSVDIHIFFKLINYN